MPYPLNVAFVWHMHQPYYRNSLSGEHRLPWVRLHATKDYLHMAEVLASHPTVHQTFNFVPSLVEQLLEYGTGEATDPWLRLSAKRDLSEGDRRFILDSFFSIHVDRFIKRIPRYDELLKMRERVGDRLDLLWEGDWLDLIAWFNLAWIDPEHIANDAQLSALFTKGRGFTRDDIDLILAKHRIICSDVVPAYRQLRDRGQVELITCPYFHPILPLLIDSTTARDATPNMKLPSQPFAYPEDASEQIRRAIRYHSEVFGQVPSGMWPPEGAVSQEAISMIESHDQIRWIATDEAILARSLGISFTRDAQGNVVDPRRLYQPYVTGGEPGIAVIFRDVALSDRIGFQYSQWESDEAAADTIARLELAADRLVDSRQPHLVSIVLDGENCWEYYENNGNDFLHALYSGFEASKKLRTVTVSEYLSEHSPRVRLDRVRAGSWIYGNLETWIGEPEQNRAWEYLALARARITAWQRDAAPEDVASLEPVWRQLYTCEGSDWFWWYYSRNRPSQGGEYDAEFRSHLAAIYAAMGQQHPAWLDAPIVAPQQDQARSITGYLTAQPGRTDWTPAGWESSGLVEPRRSTGSMQRSSSIVRSLRFGYNPRELGLRLEANVTLRGLSVAFYLGSPTATTANSHVRAWETNTAIEAHGVSLTHEILIHSGTQVATISRAARGDAWKASGTVDVTATDRAIEVRVPLEALGLTLETSVTLVATVARDGALVETVPERSAVSFDLEPR